MTDTSKMRRATEDQKAAMVADYDTGMTCAAVAAKWGFAPSSVNRYIRKAKGMGPAKARRQQLEAEVALTSGSWVRAGLVMRWEPWLATSVADLSDRERRVQWEDAMFDEDEARDLHARYANGCRESRTVVGERVYQRRKKRAQAARKRAA
mgnify:CR=1 FL=1